MKKWLNAFRLRTLPLALSSIILGSFLAYYSGNHSPIITVLAIVTTIFLQVLSNLANDYGDTVSGVDNENRVGPARSMQSGEISKGEMKIALIIFTLLSLVSGITLIYFGTKGISLNTGLLFFVLGIAAIAAAMKYTMGKNPYGYMGLGDLFVFLFFGLTGVLGTYYLHTHTIDWSIVLPATSVGLFSTAVLNLNNMRDRDNDAKSGKITLVVKMGIDNAKIYHTLLISLSVACALVFTFMHYTSIYQLIYLVILPIMLSDLIVVWKHKVAATLDAELKKVALATLLFSLSFGGGLIINYA